MADIPDVMLKDLEKDGWPSVKYEGNFGNENTLKELARNLRNSIAHFNIRFLAPCGKITGVEVWNMNRGAVTWKATIPIEDLETIVKRFCDLVTEANPVVSSPPIA